MWSGISIIHDTSTKADQIAADLCDTSMKSDQTSV